MSIIGLVQETNTNDYGYTRYKVSGTWYGADKKGAAKAVGGDKVEFEAFEKPGKDGKTWPTIKSDTFKKLPKEAATESATTPGASPSRTGKTFGGNGTVRDSYWSDKAAEDAKKDPRISFYASYERAVQFVDLALRNGAFTALEKAKPTAKLDVLQAFVSEQTLRIMAEAYAAVQPTAKPLETKAEAAAEAAVPEADEEWA